jgi:uncharacterized protein YdiU (UPF0061 family)
MTRIPFDNTYVRLPERFYTRTRPAPAREPRLIRINRALAEELRIDPASLEGAEVPQLFAGNTIPEGAEPIAMAYAGHQFGSFVPQLGDGRAILLGEVVRRAGARRDIQLKGAGRTPWSRGGDGRAALGPVLREYVVSEAMAALGIPTTRSLAAVTTGETVMRDEPLPGAVLARVAASHIRVGTFQYFASRRDIEGVKALADHVIARHYPHVAGVDRPYVALLREVVAAQANLIASWLLVGFIHGVMNTDNMAVSGETIDYGPCAFMDEYDPATVFSSIDRTGRYAYGNQPGIGGWNLARLAECLLPLIDDDPEQGVAVANEALAEYAGAFERAHMTGLRRKLGLTTEDPEDVALAHDLLAMMAGAHADHTNTFRRLCDAAEGDDSTVRAMFPDAAAWDAWAARWRERRSREDGDDTQRAAAMRRVSPAYIPRNHRVEAMIRAAVDHDDFAPFEELLEVLSSPFEERPRYAAYMEPPQRHERVMQTFCGT